MSRWPVRQLCLLAVFALLCALSSSVLAQSFNISANGFNTTNVCSSGNVTQGCQVATNGSAALVAGGETPSFLQLTPAQGSQTGSAWYVTPQPFALGFDTKFQFQLTNVGGADGIAFVIQSAGLSAIGFTGGSGGALGYGGDDANQAAQTGIPSSVAFEFDTFQNGWDPDGNHVAIQSCGPNPNTSHHNALCPSNPGYGNSTIAIATSKIPLTGAAHLAEIQYVVGAVCGDGCLNTLTISIDGNVVLSADVDLTQYLGSGSAYVGFTGATGAISNNQDILSWSFSATQASAPQNNTAGTTNTFTFTPPGVPLVQHSLAFPSDATPPDGIDPKTLVIQSTNNLVSDSAVFPQYTVGTPFGPAHCFIKPGDVFLSGGTDTCSLYEDACADNMHPFSEANCLVVPQGSPNLIQVTDLWDAPTGKVPIALNTTAALIHFFPTHNETWDPFGTIPEPVGAVNPACTDPTSSTNTAPPNNCDLLNLKNFTLTGDPTTSGGTSRKGKFISVYGVPMLETTVSANGTQLNTPGVQGPLSSSWVRSSTLNLNFLVNPAQAPPPPNNNFRAAPVNQLTYGLTDLAGANVIIPDTTVHAADLTQAVPVNFMATTPPLADGKYLLHWSSLDNVGIKEQNIQLQPQGAACPNALCYTTNPFDVELNIDANPPAVSLVTPPGPQPTYPSATYPANSAVYASYSCSDPAGGSGLATCVGTVPSGNKIDTMPAGISTSKTFTVTATDVAGNTSNVNATYYVSCHYVQFGVNPTTVARGGTVTVSTSIMDCQSKNQYLTIQLSLSGPLGYHCSNITLPMLSFPLIVPAGTSKSFSFPVTIPKCECGGTFTLTTKTFVNKVQVDQTSASLTVQ